MKEEKALEVANEKPRPVVGDNRTQVQRFIEILAHCRRGGVLDVANIDEMLAYFEARKAEEASHAAQVPQVQGIGIVGAGLPSHTMLESKFI